MARQFKMVSTILDLAIMFAQRIQGDRGHHDILLYYGIVGAV